jgi:hypothetical protein
MSPAPTPLAPDLYPRTVREGVGPNGAQVTPSPDASLARIDENLDILTRLNLIERGFTNRSVLVTTAPTQIVDGQFLRGYVFLNPSQTAGLTSTGTMFASAARPALAYTSVEIGVANYRNGLFWLDITNQGAGATLQVDLQTQDPLTLNWATAQTDIFGGSAAVGTYYQNVGNVGVDVNMRLVATVAVNPITFSISYGLKDGLAGSSSGLTRTIYLGGPDVTAGQGYPLLEGATLTRWFRPNTTLFAVSQVAAGVSLNVFESQ